jgi:hypothetical protein
MSWSESPHTDTITSPPAAAPTIVPIVTVRCHQVFGSRPVSIPWSRSVRLRNIVTAGVTPNVAAARPAVDGVTRDSDVGAV